MGIVIGSSIHVLFVLSSTFTRTFMLQVALKNSMTDC